jgi:hypothetical protein
MLLGLVWRVVDEFVKAVMLSSCVSESRESMCTTQPHEAALAEAASLLQPSPGPQIPQGCPIGVELHPIRRVARYK